MKLATSKLPSAGPIGELVTEMISAPPADTLSAEPAEEAARLVALVEDPLADDDLQLALYLCFELHYRSFPEVDPAWEWDPSLLAARAVLERAFFDALEAAVGPGEPVAPAEVGDLLFRLESEAEGVSLSRHLEVNADIEEFREFVAHRSLYQLKESDPHSWAIPRLDGAAKTALLEVQADEYGGGRVERMHQELFKQTMRWFGLDLTYGGYVGVAPAATLAVNNLMSLFGLHRANRGAILGHLAAYEMTSSLPNRAYANGLRRLGGDPAATAFYDEHVEADAVHEQIAANDLCGTFARDEPELAGQVLWGARCALAVDNAWATTVLDAWAAGRSSLRN